MKTILLICVVVFVTGIKTLNFVQPGRLLKNYPPPPPESYQRQSAAISVGGFIQKLDHYDPTNKAMWSQRYFVNSEYFDTVGRNVAFLMIGPEAEASEAWMNYGSWVVAAKKYKAILFQLEHRFYGASQPFGDLSLENLRYLTSQQALGDLATFIDSMNKEYQLSSDVKWILFGGSYSGSLAAWMREKYPHLVHGAMSSSGPLLAELDFYEYMQVVADDLSLSSQECVDTVQVAVNQIENLLKSPGDENVTSMFNLCYPIEEHLDNIWDIAYFFQSITVVFAAIAQYNHIPGVGVTIDDLCDILSNKAIGTEAHRLAAVNTLYYGTFCIDFSYETHVIETLKDISIDGLGERQWIYQTCTEFGWYQTTNQEVPVFGNRTSLDFFTRLCTEIFGPKFNETYISKQTDRTNTNYGGLDIKASNIVYVHGSMDPWHAAGLLETTNPQSPVILINGTSHCANYYEETPNDVPGLIAARKEVDRLIGVWLGVTPE